MAEARTRHFISDRQLKRAIENRLDPEAAIRELLDEAWNRGFSAGQMKARLNPNALDHDALNMRF
jgi:hypothetical protein